jgi:hypothetical protein
MTKKIILFKSAPHRDTFIVPTLSYYIETERVDDGEVSHLSFVIHKVKAWSW